MPDKKSTASKNLDPPTDRNARTISGSTSSRNLNKSAPKIISWAEPRRSSASVHENEAVSTSGIYRNCDSALTSSVPVVSVASANTSSGNKNESSLQSLGGSETSSSRNVSLSSNRGNPMNDATSPSGSSVVNKLSNLGVFPGNNSSQSETICSVKGNPKVGHVARYSSAEEFWCDGNAVYMGNQLPKVEIEDGVGVSGWSFYQTWAYHARR